MSNLYFQHYFQTVVKNLRVYKSLSLTLTVFSLAFQIGSYAQAPANDDVCGATSISCGASINGTTVNATISGALENFTNCGGYTQNTPAVWYQFVGNGQIVTFSLCSSAVYTDTELGIYSGTSCATASCLAANDDNGPSCASLQSSISIPTTVGTNYYIKVFSWNTFTPNFNFTLTATCVVPPTPPANDLICNATPIACGGSATSTTVGATLGGAGETGACSGYGQNTPAVWYSIVGTGGIITASLCNTTPAVDSEIAIYSGSCTSPNCLTAVDDFGPSCATLQASVSFQSTVGVTYFIKVWRWSSFYNPNGTIGTFTLNVNCTYTGPPNDPCTGATLIGIPYNSGVVSAAQATSSSDGAVPLVASCGNNSLALNNTLWYQVVGDGTTYTASTNNTGTNNDTEVQVFTGDCTLGLTNVTCGNLTGAALPCTAAASGESVTWCTRNGTTYYILVGSETLNCPNSNFVLTVNSTAVPSGTNLVQGDMLWRGANGAPPAKNITPLIYSATDDWNVASNWYSFDEVQNKFIPSSSVPTVNNNVFIPALGGCTSQLPYIYQAGAAYANNLTIMNGARVTFGQTTNTPAQVGSLEIKGDLLVSGQLVAGCGSTVSAVASVNKATGLVKFTGNNNQTISHAELNPSTSQPIRGTLDLYNMEVNISGTNTGLVLNLPVHIINDLMMTQGNILTTSSNYLCLGYQATSPIIGSISFPANSQYPGSPLFSVTYSVFGPYNLGTVSATNPTVSWTSGSVVGPMFRYTRTNVAATDANSLFPVGGSFNGNIVNRNAFLKWANTATTSAGLLRAQYITGNVPFQTGMNLVEVDGSLTLGSIATEGYWEIHPYNLSNVAQTTFSTNPTYNLFLRGNQYPSISANYTNARIIKAMGATPSTWVTPAPNWGTHNTVTGTTNDFTVSRNSMLSFSIFALAIPPIPQAVEFLGASYECIDNGVEFKWSTATEHNSDYFLLERSDDGLNWSTLLVQESIGNTSEQTDYRRILPEPTGDMYYLRLSEYDTDGTVDHLGTFAINCSGTSTIFTYPNPSDGQCILSISDKDFVGKVDLVMTNALGETVAEQQQMEVVSGSNNYSLNLKSFEAGIYFITITKGEHVKVIKHVIH